MKQNDMLKSVTFVCLLFTVGILELIVTINYKFFGFIKSWFMLIAEDCNTVVQGFIKLIYRTNRPQHTVGRDGRYFKKGVSYCKEAIGAIFYEIKLFFIKINNFKNLQSSFRVLIYFITFLLLFFVSLLMLGYKESYESDVAPYFEGIEDKKQIVTREEISFTYNNFFAFLFNMDPNLIGPVVDVFSLPFILFFLVNLLYVIVPVIFVERILRALYDGPSIKRELSPVARTILYSLKVCFYGILLIFIFFIRGDINFNDDLISYSYVVLIIMGGICISILKVRRKEPSAEESRIVESSNK